MNDQEYQKGLTELLGIFQRIESGGVMSAMQHKARLEKLAPEILKEAARREGIGNGG